MQNEIWKQTEYKGYMVSNMGRVKSVNKILTPTDNGHGYKTVMLSVDGRAFRRYVHRLAAIAFIPNVDNYPEINHKNGIKSDNRIDNLEWCSSEMNKAHAHTMGLVPKWERTEEYRKKVSKTVKKLWKDGIYKVHTWTDEQKEHARQAQINSKNKKRGKDHPCAVKVRCVETNEVFDCIVDADKKYGNGKKSVHQVFSKKQKTAYGWHWERIVND